MRVRLISATALWLLFACLARAGTFTHIQGSASGGGGSTTLPTSISMVLPSTPVQGNLLVFWMFLYGGVTFSNVVVKDANNNAFTLTPISAANSANGTSADGMIYAGYILSAPSGMSTTINATWTGSADAYRETLYVDEFHYTGGTVSFDKEAFYDSAAHSVASETINLPSITATQSGELLYGAAQGNASITTGTQGVWTMSGGGYSTYDSDAMTQYLLSSSTSPTAINLTQAGSADWVGYIMGFEITAPGIKRRSPGVY